MIGNPHTGVGSNALLTTIRHVFKTVDVYPLGDTSTQMMNFVVHAYDTDLVRNETALFTQIHNNIGKDKSLATQLKMANNQFFEFKPTDTTVLTDNSNKIGYLSQLEKSNARRQLYPFILKTMF